MNVLVESTPHEAAVAAANHVAQCIRDTGGPCALGLAGGSTPAPAYRAIRTLDIDWPSVTCWLPDERYVEADDPESNTRLAKRYLTDHVPARLLAPDCALGDPALTAANYEHSLGRIFRDGRPDVVMLGMGGDGHTASLFPGTDALAVTRSGYVANWVPQLDCWRLTATLPLLQSARKVVFLVTGESKAGAVRRVLGDGEALPARRVGEGAAEVTWILDEGSAALL